MHSLRKPDMLMTIKDVPSSDMAARLHGVSRPSPLPPPQVLAMEAEAESTALLLGGDKIESEFLALETGTGGWDSDMVVGW